MNHLLRRIDDEIEKKSLLKNRFYKMWSNGELTLDHLKGYSMEYFQLVKAVPQMVDNVAVVARSSNEDNTAINQNREEEESHIAPWIKFANSLGVGSNLLWEYRGDSKTNKAVLTLAELTRRSFEEGVSALYSYELELPKISRRKIDGLNEFYNINDKNAVNYFEIHEEVDIRHANVWRKMINSFEENKSELAFNAASKSLDAQNLLLDAVYEKYVVNN